MSNLSWSIGAVRVTRIVEREVPIAIADLIPAATASALAPHRDWLAPHFLDTETQRCTLSIHALLIESAGLRIIVDTCIGEHRIEGMDVLNVETQPFLEQLAAAGFAAESIDIVLCTHLHFDHVGWNTRWLDGRWQPTFPNARYLFSRTEWEYWSGRPAGETRTLSSETMASETMAPVIAAGLADFVDMDYALTPDVRLEPTPGHTPGHVSVLIESEGKSALITGDLTHHPVQWAEPDWGTIADVDRETGTRTRRRLRERHAGDGNLLVIGTHYPAPCAGYLTQDSMRTFLRIDAKPPAKKCSA